MNILKVVFKKTVDILLIVVILCLLIGIMLYLILKVISFYIFDEEGGE